MNQSGPLERVIDLFAEMPGIGKRTAQRLTYFLLNREPDYASHLANAIAEMRNLLRPCQRCYNISSTELCSICEDTKREDITLCVVEDAVNVANIERSGGFRGYYHVLGGVLSPVNGIGPDDLRIKELLLRLQQEDTVEELILATNPTVEGEATAMYLADLLRPTGLKLSRIGMGVPIGGNLDYCDDVTMAKALENRRLLTP
jgi:recombination protein RecR